MRNAPSPAFCRVLFYLFLIPSWSLRNSKAGCTAVTILKHREGDDEKAFTIYNCRLDSQPCLASCRPRAKRGRSRSASEALIVKFDEAYNRSDAVAIADLFTPDAVQVWEWESAGGVASGQQAIEKRYEAQFVTSPRKLVRKLVWYIQSATKYVRSRRSHTLTCLASRVTV